MQLRHLVSGGVIAGAMALSTVAAAAPGTATGNVNMRSGPGTQYSVITTIPAGAPIEVFGCQSWCEIAYAGTQGYVSGNYVSSGGDYLQPAPRAYYQPAPRVFYQPTPVPYGYYRGGSRWGNDDWNGDRSRYRHNRRDDWSRSSSGIYFGFGN